MQTTTAPNKPTKIKLTVRERKALEAAMAPLSAIHRHAAGESSRRADNGAVEIAAVLKSLDQQG
jgi:hypothetical protein